jgi:hypothetical protein
MAGKKDIVEQALKLIAGGAKEAAPSAAERAAQNLDVFNTAKRLGEDTNDIAKLQETKRLMDFHKSLTGDIRERAKSVNEIVQQMKASGAFPMEIGTRYTTEHSRRTGQPPWTITNYYVDPKNPQGSYGYYVRREFPDGGYEESVSKIRDPRLEALHGAEKWEELQRGFVPMTGPKVVKAEGGSIREGYAGRGRVVGDIVDQALKLATGEGEEAAKTGIRAYHGSPHDFDKFDMSKIGTGEGAQAYGHGLYFAGNEGIARHYRDALSSNKFRYEDVQPDDEALKKFANQLADVETRQKNLSDPEGFISLDNNYGELENLQSEKDKIRNMMIMDTVNRNPHLQYGRMYEVNIAADPRNDFINYDAPWEEQPQKVKDAFSYLSKNRPDGSDLARRIEAPIFAQEASERGVKGIQFLDAGSRVTPRSTFNAENAYWDAYAAYEKNPTSQAKAALDVAKANWDAAKSPPSQTRNYVVFDDKLISIIRKYGIAGASAMLGYNLMENLDPKQALAATMADNDYQASAPQKADGGAVREGYAGKGRVVGDIVDQALKLITGEGEKAAQKGIRAYHGSPHKFDEFRFTPREIGSGEGAQAYGYGGYFAESEPLAESYTKARDWSYKGKSAQDIYDDLYKISRERNLDNEGWSKLNAQRGFWERVLTGRSPRSIIMEGKINPDDYGASDLAYHRTLDPSKFVRNEGHMYEVGINSDPNAFVDWDKLISEQPEAFREYMRDQLKKQGYLRAKENGPRQLNSALKAWNMEKGSMLDTPIQSIIMGRGEIGGGTPVGVSKDLQSLGLPGVKFLDSQSRGLGTGTRNYVVFPGNEDLVNIIRSYADGGAVDEDDDVNDALRIAKQEGGVLMEDAKGNKYDAQGNLIPPTAPGPDPARTPTPQEVGQKASMDPATFDALMEQYAVPDRDIAQYEATKAAVAAQPREIQQMTHVGDRPTREVKVDMPLFGGEYSVGSAPYDVAGNMSGVAQAAYDFKTAPFYAIPFTAPIAAGMDVAEGIATNDPLTASLAVGFGPGSKYAKAAGIGTINYLMDPSEAEAGPARWFSKAMEAAQAIPMEKMTGQQALAMLKKSVSPEELRWTGTDVFLSTTPKISKEELLDYLRNNRFQTEDVTLGGNKPTSRKDVKPTPTASAPYMEEWNKLKAEDEKLNAEFDSSDADKSVQGMENYWRRQFEIDEQKDALREKMIDATIAEMGGLGLPVQYGPGSRYGDAYVTRGGEGYSEDLYKMPNAMKAYNLYVKQLREKYGEGALGDMPLTVSERGTLDNLMEAGGDERKVYTSGHFPQYPGYLAHSRSQILNIETPGANRPYKAWNVEEAQSDLAKSGRKSGFYDPVVYQKWANEYYANEKAIEKARDYLTEVSNRVSEAIGPEPKAWRDPAWNEYHIRRQDALDASPEVKSARETLNNLIARGAELDAAIPNTVAAPIGPFVKSMEGWSKLTIKKQLDKAFDSGADYFTWTPGEAQAQRYSLSKVADRITYNPPFVSASGKQYAGRIVAIKNGSAVFEKNGVTPDKLPEFIGEELASKLLKNKEVIESGKFEGLERYSVSGDEMKFGGEGMRKYYDSAFVKYVQDVFKEATGEKPKIEVVTAQTPDGPRQQLGVRLTEEMREKARFSDFNKGGRVTDRAKYADSDTVSRALALTSEV